ncbi:hypothetical protein ACIPWB_31995 [[Kitasatospora] papulosa]|uniref:hypothetical protein n=1 Tax=[Kitasatospora] papulosa TaxID=1464011 RepID=UPI00382DFF50
MTQETRPIASDAVLDPLELAGSPPPGVSPTAGGGGFARATRLLAGQVPPGGACDVKMLAREADIFRAALYRTWGHLKEEFEKRRAAARAAGQQPDPGEARVARLRDLKQRLIGKLARTHTELTQLKERHQLLLSVLAAKDDELQRLRREINARWEDTRKLSSHYFGAD